MSKRERLAALAVNRMKAGPPLCLPGQCPIWTVPTLLKQIVRLPEGGSAGFGLLIYPQITRIDTNRFFLRANSCNLWVL